MHHTLPVWQGSTWSWRSMYLNPPWTLSTGPPRGRALSPTPTPPPLISPSSFWSSRMTPGSSLVVLYRQWTSPCVTPSAFWAPSSLPGPRVQDKQDVLPCSSWRISTCQSQWWCASTSPCSPPPSPSGTAAATAKGRLLHRFRFVEKVIGCNPSLQDPEDSRNDWVIYSGYKLFETLPSGVYCSYFLL